MVDTARAVVHPGALPGLHAIKRAVDHPWYPELVEAHAKTLREEGLAERHVGAATFAQRVELALGLGDIFDRDRDREALRLVIMIRRRVGRHQHLAVDRKPGVHD